MMIHNVREKAAAAMRAFFKAGMKLVRKDVTQCVELVGVDCVVRIHGLNACVHRTGAKAHIDFDCFAARLKVVPRRFVPFDNFGELRIVTDAW